MDDRHGRPQQVDWQAETLLASLNIPHLSMVLDECFQILPPRFSRAARGYPTTIAEVAIQSRVDVADVIDRLSTVCAEISETLISDLELRKQLASWSDQDLLMDLRGAPGVHSQQASQPLPFVRVNWQEGSHMLTERRRVVCVCDDGARSLSAALYLRSEKGMVARSLAGGWTAWVGTREGGPEGIHN